MSIKFVTKNPNFPESFFSLLFIMIPNICLFMCGPKRYNGYVLMCRPRDESRS